MSVEESSKREEERLNRILNNAGKARAARPVSWNVAQTGGLAGQVGTTGRSSAAAASLKAMQEQIREEERKQQQQFPRSPSLASHPPKSSSPSPYQQPKPSSPSPYQQNGNNQNLNGDDDDSLSEADRKLKLEEERLERWMKKGDNDRRRSISMDSALPDITTTPTPTPARGIQYQGPAFELVTQIQEQLHLAAKALRQSHVDDIVRHGLSVASTGKNISVSLSNDPEILALAHALETTVSVLRANETSEEVQRHITEVASSLGRLFISVIGAL